MKDFVSILHTLHYVSYVAVSLMMVRSKLTNSDRSTIGASTFFGLPRLS
jgi:hypothetical protein